MHQTHSCAGQLDRLERATLHMRDAFNHWDSKSERAPETNLSIDLDGIAVVAPPGTSATETEVASLSWEELYAAADTCGGWARMQGGR